MPSNLLDNCVSIAFAILPEVCKEKNHFTFLTKGSSIVAVGINSCKTHPLASKYGYHWPSLHSELSAYIKCPKDIDFSRCRMINIRLSRASLRAKRPILRMSKPCETCHSWVCALGLREILYTTDSGFTKL